MQQYRARETPKQRNKRLESSEQYESQMRTSQTEVVRLVLNIYVSTTHKWERQSLKENGPWDFNIYASTYLKKERQSLKKNGLRDFNIYASTYLK